MGDLLKRSGAVMNHRPKLYSPDGSSGQPNPYSYEGQRFMTIETYNSKSACALKVEARHGK